MNTPKSRRLSLLTAAIGLFVGIGLTVSLYFVLSPSLEEEHVAQVPISPSSIDFEKSAEHSVVGEPSEPNATPRGLSREGFEDIFNLDSDFERVLALYSLLERADKKQLLILLDESTDLHELIRPIIQRALIHRLTTIDPESALSQARVLEDIDIEELLKSVFDHWSRIDLDEAITHAKSLSRLERQAALRGIFLSRSEMSDSERLEIGQELGEHQFAEFWNSTLKENEYARDPERSWNELVEAAQNDANRLTLLITIAEAWFKEAGLDVVDRIIESTSNQQTRSSVLQSVFRLAAQSNPQPALERALQIEHDQWLAISVVNEWTQSDPKSAVKTIYALAPQQKRWRLLENALSLWAHSVGPIVMLGELDGLNEEVQEHAIQKALSTLASSSPKEAADLIDRLEDLDAKREIASQIIWSWSRRDPKEALHWILNTPHMEPFRNDLMSDALGNLAEENPSLAMETALSQPTEEGEVGLEFHVISSIASANVERAREFLPQVRDSKTKMYAYSSVGVQMVANGNFEEALDLGRDVDSHQDSYYRMLSLAWSTTDPDELFASIDKFPSDESQSKAAAILTLLSTMSSQVSDKQVEELKQYLLEEDQKELEKGGMGLLNVGPMKELLGI